MPQIILVLGIAGGISGSRVARGAVIGIKENDYFRAAQAIGTSTPRTVLRHVLPNIMAPMLDMCLSANKYSMMNAVLRT